MLEIEEPLSGCETPDAELEKQATEFSGQNERLRAALHVAVQTPNPREVVPGANATAKPASSNATSLTNATAAADPM
jgi:hypothetical protein